MRCRQEQRAAPQEPLAARPLSAPRAPAARAVSVEALPAAPNLAAWASPPDARLENGKAGSDAVSEGAQDEFLVAGAGGVGFSCNGLYRRAGTYGGKPRYRKVGGEATMYFRDNWKINYRSNSDGWYYAMSGTIGDQPPTGRWTTCGYTRGDADPAPTVTKIDEVAPGSARYGSPRSSAMQLGEEHA